MEEVCTIQRQVTSGAFLPRYMIVGHRADRRFVVLADTDTIAAKVAADYHGQGYRHVTVSAITLADPVPWQQVGKWRAPREAVAGG